MTTHGLVKLFLLNTLLFARITVISHVVSNKGGWLEDESQGAAFCVIHSCCLQTRRNAGRREDHVTLAPQTADSSFAAIGQDPS